MRASIWFSFAWYVRNGLYVGFRPEQMLYGPDGNLLGSEVMAHLRQQLCTCTWHRDKQGRLLIIDKDEWRKLIGMSPDIGDAAALTCIDRWAGADPSMAAASPGASLTRDEEEQIMSEY